MIERVAVRAVEMYWRRSFCHFTDASIAVVIRNSARVWEALWSVGLLPPLLKSA
jgi:hypothetical protein